MIDIWTGWVHTELYHHGILGQKWGLRRYQNPDGSLTDEGRMRYNKYKERKIKAVQREYKSKLEDELMPYNKPILEKERDAKIEYIKNLTEEDVSNYMKHDLERNLYEGVKAIGAVTMPIAATIVEMKAMNYFFSKMVEKMGDVDIGKVMENVSPEQVDQLKTAVGNIDMSQVEGMLDTSSMNPEDRQVVSGLLDILKNSPRYTSNGD